MYNYPHNYPSILMSSPALLCLLPLVFPPLSLADAGDETKTVYEVLEDYDFPSGLLPKGVVTGYDLDETTGKFSVYMNQSFSFTIDGYALKYRSTISGVISKDRLGELKGVSVKILLFWVNIIGVRHDGDALNFSVGIVSADFPADNFVESPQCGCGFDCNHEVWRGGWQVKSEGGMCLHFNRLRGKSESSYPTPPLYVFTFYSRF